MPVTASDLLKYIQISGFFHSFNPKIPSNAKRLWDRRTPYIVHPLWCATTIAFEQKLPTKIRARGILVLLFHDILEDTDGKLPIDLPIDVVQGIEYMTFHENHVEKTRIWSLPPEIRLFKLYDKTCNLLDEYETDPEKKENNRKFIAELTKDVENHYGALNITIIARSIVKK
jgi:hypothetical protein